MAVFSRRSESAFFADSDVLLGVRFVPALRPTYGYFPFPVSCYLRDIDYLEKNKKQRV